MVLSGLFHEIKRLPVMVHRPDNEIIRSVFVTACKPCELSTLRLPTLNCGLEMWPYWRHSIEYLGVNRVSTMTRMKGKYFLLDLRKPLSYSLTMISDPYPFETKKVQLTWGLKSCNPFLGEVKLNFYACSSLALVSFNSRFGGCRNSAKG